MVLSCQDIGKSFGDITILSHISFHIEDYEKAAIVGINGAGKTTLLKSLLENIRLMKVWLPLEKAHPGDILHSMVH